MAELKWRENARGTLEGYDPKTGVVVETGKEGPHIRHRRKPNRRKVAVVTQEDGTKILINPGVNTAKLPYHQDTTVKSEFICDAILSAVMNGKTLSEVCREMNLSFDLVCKWRRKDEEFEKEYRIAERMRAGVFHDKVLATADKAEESEIGVARLQVETYKWAAKVGDAEKFGDRTKLVGDASQPVAIFVETGIRRDGDEGAIEIGSDPKPVKA